MSPGVGVGVANVASEVALGRDRGRSIGKTLISVPIRVVEKVRGVLRSSPILGEGSGQSKQQVGDSAANAIVVAEFVVE